jgi:hypothetical protein
MKADDRFAIDGIVDQVELKTRFYSLELFLEEEAEHA